MPGLVGVNDVKLVILETNPAWAEDAVQVNVTPTLLFTLRLTVLPKHTGFGFAAKPVGAGGAFGSVKLIGPANRLD